MVMDIYKPLRRYLVRVLRKDYGDTKELRVYLIWRMQKWITFILGFS